VRIIAGQARGRRLVAPKGQATRPTPDRVRESLFSIVQERLADAQVLDLFAGTGALGLEALSRGARSVTFVEEARSALTALQRNIETVGIGKPEVLPLAAQRAVGKLAERGRAFDLVFLDPPYAAGLLPQMLAALAEHALLLPRALVVCEHHGRDVAPNAPPSYQLLETRAFGDVSLSFFEFRPGERTDRVTIALYPGSFDPVTYGHLNILERALKVFDRVIVGVAINVTKTPLFTPTERMQIFREAIGNEERVEIDSFDGLLVDYATRRGANVIVRGLRAISDFEFEFQMAHMNRKLNPQLETIFMMTGEDYFFVSSQMVREIAKFRGDLHGLVPPSVEKRLQEKFHRP
jgi:pantetheine-phosphate adenylyltransferase